MSGFAVGYPYILFDRYMVGTQLPWVGIDEMPLLLTAPVSLAYLINIILLLIFSVKDGVSGANKYGLRPRPGRPARRPVSVPVLVCAQCQTELNPDAKFCTVCGTQVSQAIHDEIVGQQKQSQDNWIYTKIMTWINSLSKKQK